MKYFIVTDIHSFYDEMIAALEKAGYDKDNKEHIFVSLGDLFDRGNKSNECLEFVNSIPEERKILIRGNHEDCMQEAINRRRFLSRDVYNGTPKTVIQFYEKFHPDEDTDNLDDHIILQWMSTFEDYKKYISSLRDYFVVCNNILVHGWIPYWVRNINDLKLCDNSDWYDARWSNGMREWHNGLRLKGYTIFCGHRPTSFGHSRYHHDGVEFLDEVEKDDYDKSDLHENFSPFIDDGIIALDACTVYSGKVNCYVLDI